MTPSTHEALVAAKAQLVTLGGDPRKSVSNEGDPNGDEIQAAVLDILDAALLPDPKADGAGALIGRLRFAAHQCRDIDKNSEIAIGGIAVVCDAAADSLSTLNRERDEAEHWIRDHGLRYERQAVEAEATIAELTARLAEAEWLQDDYSDLIADLEAGASKSIDVGSHLRKYQELCDRAAVAIGTLNRLLAFSRLAASPSQGQPTKAREGWTKTEFPSWETIAVYGDTAIVSPVADVSPMEARNGRSGAILEFVNLILHGDAEHRRWLMQAANDYLDGKPVCPPALSSPAKASGDDPVVPYLRNEGQEVEADLVGRDVKGKDERP